MEERNISDYYAAIPRRNMIWMPAVAVYRRGGFHAVAVFDTRLSRVANYDLYLRIARHCAVVTHYQVVAKHRKRGGIMTRQTSPMPAGIIAAWWPQWSDTKHDTGYRQAFLASPRAWSDNASKTGRLPCEIY